MGFSKNTSNWFSPKKGFLVGKLDGEEIQSRSFVGEFIGVEIIDDDYEGQEFRKVVTTWKDNSTDDDKIKTPIKITFRLDSWFSQSFFSRFEKAKIKPATVLTIGVSNSEQNDKVNFCWLKDADDKVIKKDKDYAKPETVQVNKKDVPDWAKFSEHVEKFVEIWRDDLPF